MTNLQQIENYPNYFITEDGRVWNERKKAFLKPRINKGYYQIMLCKQSKHKTFKLHRLVALAYVPNPLNNPEINHLDGNKLNNHYSNLQWCTRSENNLHRYSSGLFKPTEKMLNQIRLNGLGNKKKNYKTKLVLNTTTGIFYDNVEEAAISANKNNGVLLRSKLAGKRKNNTDFIFA